VYSFTHLFNYLFIRTHKLCSSIDLSIDASPISFVIQLDSWSVILNGSVEIETEGEETTVLHLGDSFGVEPTLKKMHHKGVMKTCVDDCQVRYT